MARPEMTAPTMIESLREYRSATMPVGTSNRKYASSSAVPARTSWSGDMPTSRTK
jgi:hypothetical protein